MAMITGELKHFGLTLEEPEEEAYVLGGRDLPRTVLQEDGDWRPYLPQYEPQFNAFYDTHGCVVWALQNGVETILKKLEGVEYNFSERFTYIICGIRPPGSDPHKVAECIRENGLVDDELLPFTETFEEFLTPDPMEARYLVEGAKFPYEIKHEYLWKGDPSLGEKHGKIKECLRYSIILLSVTAWFQNEKGEYVDNGMDNTHLCLAVYMDEKNRIHVFDSYDQHMKILSPDHNIKVAKRLHLVKKSTIPKKNWLEELCNNLGGFFGDIVGGRLSLKN